MLVFNDEQNCYTRYFHLSEMDKLLPLLEKIQKNVKYQSIDEIPYKSDETFENIIIDDKTSLEQFFNNNPDYNLELPMNRKRMTLFLLACQLSTDDEGIKYLIDKGCEINRTDTTGNNALMFLIYNQNMPTEIKLRTIQLLIDKGIDINWINYSFQTPLVIALQQIEIEITDLLMRNGGVVLLPNNKDLTTKDKKETTEEA